MKRGWILILAIAVAAVLMIVIPQVVHRDMKAEQSLTVYVDGSEYLRAPLVNGKSIEIKQEDGCINVIHMTEDGFYMESSTCPNQECIDQGEVNATNWKTRKLLNQIICLPNRVVVQLDTVTDNADPAVPDV